MRASRVVAVVIAVVVGVLLVLAFAGVGRDTPGLGAAPATDAVSAPQQTLTGTVRLAAVPSMRRPLTQITQAFERTNPGVKVLTSYLTAPQIASQLRSGAAAPDLVVLDSPATMSQLQTAGLVRAPSTVALDRLAIAVARNNPLGVSSLGDLAKPGRRVILCDATIPCGLRTAGVLAAANTKVQPVARVVDGTDAVDRISAGQADAAIVWASESSAGSVQRVDIPGAANTAVELPAAVATRPANVATAEALLGALGSADSRDVLAAFGFEVPATRP